MAGRIRERVAAALGVALLALPLVARPAQADPAFNAIWMTSAALLAAGVVGDVLRGNALSADTMPDDVDLLTVGVGGYHIWKDSKTDFEDTPALFRFEYRPSYYLWIAHPFLGVEATHLGSTYLYGGLMADVRFGDHLILSPSAALGWYSQGNARDLGHPLEFRTGIEAAWRFDDGMRVGVAFHHLSNAGLSDWNPGIEELTLTLSFPIQYFVSP